MPKVKTTAPAQQRQKFQRSQDLPEYLMRYVPQWQQPQWLNAQMWRNIVNAQPVAMVCREKLISSILSLDWKIEPRDGTRRDEYRDEINYYEKFFQNNGTSDYADIVEWILQDYLDIPFGGGAELGREGDSPDGQLMWIELLDGGTLFPTQSFDFPVGQRIPDSTYDTIYFPSHAINRLYMTPRTEIRRKGWGCPPPEKIYLAIELLNRGDRYYANLLLDTPPVGLLDLGDMAEDSAKAWLSAWREMLGGVDPFKIPVLYEHEKPAQFIPFTKSPTELMFDKATLKYASLVTAGYGMSLSDIGVQTVSGGGETLAGSIRQERGTRKSGLAKSKIRLNLFFNRMLPSHLKWSFIDLDDELSLNIARARLADANAFAMLIDKRVYTPVEARHQIQSDGLMTISLAEEADEKDFDILPDSSAASPQGTNQLGRPVSPSQGGWGEKKSMLDVAMSNPEFRSAFEDLDKVWDRLDEKSKESAVQEIRGMLETAERDAIALEVLQDVNNI